MDFTRRMHYLPVVKLVRSEHLTDVSGENDAIGDEKSRRFQLGGSKSLGMEKPHSLSSALISVFFFGAAHELGCDFGTRKNFHVLFKLFN